MGIIESIIAGGVGTAFTAAGALLKDIREAITGKAILDPNKQSELALRAQELENGLILAQMAYEKSQMESQMAVNLEEAKSPEGFKSGWRPAVGWVCVLGLFYSFIVKPLLPFIFECGALIMNRDVNTVPILPDLPMGDLLLLLGGMLGLGTLRSYEKIKGVK